MKILHLISSAGFYGAENVVATLACELSKLGHAATVGLFENAHCPANGVAEQMQARGVSIVRIPCRSRWDARAMTSIRQKIASDKFDLVHTHGYKSDIYGYFAARRSRIPMVATCHLWTGSTRAVRLYERLDAFFLRRASAVVGVSEAITFALQKAGVPAKRVQTIYNGINVPAFQNAAPNLRRELEIGKRPLIGTVGRLEKQKGIEYFIRAAKGVLSEFPDAMFVIVGEGSLRNELTRTIHELSLENNVCLLGERTDMTNVYASLDVFVLASIQEGMPMTVLEAMAAGKPVVATNVGAVGRLVISEQTGILVQPRSVGDLQTGVLRYLQDSEFCSRLGNSGKSLVESSFSGPRWPRITFRSIEMRF